MAKKRPEIAGKSAVGVVICLLAATDLDELA
jgi:hypothetical protein